MIKIAITVRNRLAITRKCIESLVQHSTVPHQIYIYDNLTDYRLEDHFSYYNTLLRKKLIHQVTFNTAVSCYNSFSKAISLNDFGMHHEQDHQKNNYEMLVTLDNDIILRKEWDKILLKAWNDINRLQLKNIYVITQYLGGAVKYGKWLDQKLGGYRAYHGKLSGSCLWASRPNFYEEVGYLDPKTLININKKHDQYYWTKMETLSKGQPYVLGLDAPLLLRGGPIAGSVCNVIGYSNNPEKIKHVRYIEQDKYIDSMNFKDFYKKLNKET